MDPVESVRLEARTDLEKHGYRYLTHRPVSLLLTLGDAKVGRFARRAAKRVAVRSGLIPPWPRRHPELAIMGFSFSGAIVTSAPEAIWWSMAFLTVFTGAMCWWILRLVWLLWTDKLADGRRDYWPRYRHLVKAYLDEIDRAGIEGPSS